MATSGLPKRPGSVELSKGTRRRPCSPVSLGSGDNGLELHASWEDEGSAPEHRLHTSSLPALAPPSLVFGLISALLHKARERQEEDRIGRIQGSGVPDPEPFKADKLCFTKRLIRKHTHPQ